MNFSPLLDPNARIVVLGANGFLGSHVAELLHSGTFETVLTARRKPTASAQGRWVELDLVGDSERALGEVLERLAPQVVINCVGATTGSPDELRRVNLDATAKLVSVLSKGPGAHLVHLGSAAEYGPSESWAPVRETSRPLPASEYGSTKLAATELVAQAVANGDITATVLRVFNPIGARAPEWSLVGRTVSALREAARIGARTVTLGRLDSSRDFVDARDVATAVLAACQRGGGAGVPSVLNVGRGIPVSTRWVVRRLAEIARFDGEIVELGEASPRSDAVMWQWADTAAARVALQWMPRHQLSDALGAAWTRTALAPPPKQIPLPYFSAAGA